MEYSSCGKGVPDLIAEPEGGVEDRNTDKVNRANCNFPSCQQYNFHKIDLRPDVDKILSKFHKGCIQRKIKRAERENLHYEAGRSESSLEKFYTLLLLTRRRHGLPPQPMAWFRSLIECFGENLTIRIASKDGRPIGSILTLSHKDTLVYKYGCSDSTFHRMGAMPMLFSKAIQEARQRGVEELDLGRSEIDNPGLSAFKEHLGATRSKLAYFRLGRRPATRTAGSSMQLMRTLFTRLPSPLSRAVGAMLYKHIG
jgi:lipid II:glycine glycyltransferase (peptidoglycan interpeptide bridge formation enzyme)